MGFLKNIASKRSSLKTRNTDVTVAAQLTLRQSLWPLSIVTILFFLWVRQETLVPGIETLAPGELKSRY